MNLWSPKAEQLSLGTTKSANTRLREWMLGAGKKK
jgi:hypothetical protein